MATAATTTRGTLDRHAELLTLLHSLRLPAMADAVEALALKAAKAGLTHEAFL